MDEARISPLDTGVLHGDGVFETMRSDGGTIHRLSGHLARFRNALRSLRIEPREFASWRGILDGLLERNNLTDACARVRLHCTRGESGGRGLSRSTEPVIFAFAEEYKPPAGEEYHRGWTLHISRNIRATLTSRMKTASYLDCRIAQQEALDAGRNDALLFDAGGNVCETSTASLLYQRDGRWYYPANPTQLAGITRRHVISLMRSTGVEVRATRLHADELPSIERLWMTNALLGIMRVRSVGDLAIPEPRDGAEGPLRRLLFS